MKKNILKYVIFVIMLSIVVSGCSVKVNESTENKTDQDLKISKNSFSLNTFNTITLYGTDDDSYFESIYGEVTRLENKLSVHISGSEVAMICDNAGLRPVKVSQETFEVIEKSIEYAVLSEGLFDITIEPLVSLWSIGTDNFRLPEQSEINDAMELIDFKKIVLDDENSTVYLTEKNMSIDLGAIAKGYIADKVAKKIIELGLDSAIINFGGNVVLLGEKPDGSAFQVGIQEPDETRGGIVGTVTARNISLVTSGDYERYSVQDNTRYHHILDPFTGYPTDNNIKAVSIIANQSFDADALSTTVLLQGLEKGLAMIESLEGVEAIFITKEHEIYLSEGIKDIFKLTSGEYIIME
ncbi:MAG TPA: thiamine biosynthesis protein ApbE [Clostridiales bacterium]|nr:thiamine biosynthesis protein ApbE [Clostridiales bacterium]